MEELKILYKELQEREVELKKHNRTKLVEGMIAENLLTIARVQQLLIPLVVQRSEQLPTECVENWDKPYYCKSELGRCKKCS